MRVLEASNSSAAAGGARATHFSTGSLSRTPLKNRAGLNSASAISANTTMPRKKSLPSSDSPQELQQQRLRDLTMRTSEMRLRIDEGESGDLLRGRKSNSSSPDKSLPPGIRELETLYAPMKNLNEPLPGASRGADFRMPPLPHHPHHPMWNNANLPRPRDDDAESEVCSVVIPPALPPVQSHAILESSLGHQLPRTPLRAPKFPGGVSVNPPVPPRRTNSKLSLEQQQQQQQQPPRPKHLSLSSDPNGGAVYANVSKALLHRTSLMSTGSSENSSSDSSIPSCAGEVIPASSSSASATSEQHHNHHLANSSAAPLLPSTPSSGKAEAETTFSWPSYSVGFSPSAAAAANTSSSSAAPLLLARPSSSTSPSPSEEHRSVSQIGEHPDPSSVANAPSDCGSSRTSSSLSNVYVRMQQHQQQRRAEGDRGDSHYMNALFHSAQGRRKGSGANSEMGGSSGSVVSSPYLAMDGAGRSRSSGNVKNLPNAHAEGVSAVYSVPDISGAKRQRSSSTSRLQEVTRYGM